MDDLKGKVAAVVKAGRVGKGMTQEDLAERINLTVQSVSAIENARNLPALDTMVTLADVLGLDVAEMLGKSPKAQHRLTAELKARHLAELLDDETLRLAIRQLEALAEHSERLMRKQEKKSTLA